MRIVVCNGNTTVYPSTQAELGTGCGYYLLLSEVAQSSLSVGSIISYNTSMTRTAALVRKTLVKFIT